MLARAIFPDESGMLMEAMFGEVETLAYVIDSECRVVYFNKKMEVAFPHLETGMLCYQALRGEPASCPDCPLILDHASKSRVYNQRIRSWIETEVSDIDWPGSGACHIFLSRVIDRPDLGAADPKPFDALTGLYTREAFFSAVSTAIQAYPERSYCLMAVDIEHFKLFNEWYGEEAGDLFLEEVGRLLGEAAAESGGVSGYLSGDDFCMLLPCDEGMIETLRARITQSALHHGKGMGFLPAFGLFRIDDRSLPVGIMYDRALLALASVKGNYAQRFRWYDDGMLREIKDDHSLLLEVQQALEKGEITFYAQPKCNLDTGKIVGLEALVRWMHPERGLIPPIQFTIYESEEDASFFKVLLKDADLKSVLNSQEYKSRINMYDYELYNSLEATTKQIQAYEQELGEKQDSLTKDKDSYEQQMSELDTILDERQNELSSLDDSMRAAYSDISDIQSQIDAQNSKMASILAEEKAAAKAKAEHEAAVKQEASKNTDTKKSDSSTKKTDTSTKKNTEPTKTETSAPETKIPETSAPETKVPETEAPSNDNSYVSDGKVLSKYHGVVYGPTGKETYYNLDMSGVVRIMRDMGFSAEDYPYWVRDDGCKMLGSYIMCAANLNYFPRGTTVASSLGTCLVCDTGSFAASNPTQLDIATNW